MTENLIGVTLLWLCSERIQRKVQRHPYFACFWLNHLTLISVMPEAWILASSFDWTIAVCSMKELLQCSVLKSFNTLIATKNNAISNSHSASIILKARDQPKRSSLKYIHCINPPTGPCSSTQLLPFVCIIVVILHAFANITSPVLPKEW